MAVVAKTNMVTCKLAGAGHQKGADVRLSSLRHRDGADLPVRSRELIRPDYRRIALCRSAC